MNLLFPYCDYDGPYELTSETVDAEVPVEIKYGTYLLGKSAGKWVFLIYYVGRSDDNDDGLAGRIKSHVGESGDYEKFMWRRDDSVREAFDTECNVYHLCRRNEEPITNDRHPKVPGGETWECPWTDCDHRGGD